MAGVVVPAGADTPATLADNPEVSPQGVRRQPGPSSIAAEKSGKPPQISPVTGHTLPAGKAVPHKLQPEGLLLHRQKRAPLPLDLLNQQPLAEVGGHRRAIPEEAHPLHRPLLHAPKYAQIVDAGSQRHPDKRRAVQLHQNPGLGLGKRRLQNQMEPGPGKAELQAAAGPKQRKYPVAAGGALLEAPEGVEGDMENTGAVHGKTSLH